MPDQKSSKPFCISLVGQTATGKTAHALRIAENWLEKNPKKKVCLISADSKQVFAELPILTGADIPTNYQQISNSETLYPFLRHNSLNIEIHGVGCVPGNQEWSVGHFYRLVENLVQTQPESFFILVGGTGLYHQQIFNPAETLFITPNEPLRTELEQLSLETLQEKLKKENKEKWSAMNHSDQKNPRRLIRAIEIEAAKNTQDSSFEKQLPLLEPTHQIGLTGSDVETKIQTRVMKRLEQGVIEEVRKFEEKYPEPNLIAKSALGYQEILQFLAGSIQKEELITLWTTAEIQYSKRQTTWWKKQKSVEWYPTETFSLEKV